MRAKTIGFERGGDPYEKLKMGSHRRFNNTERIIIHVDLFFNHRINNWEVTSDIMEKDIERGNYIITRERDPAYFNIVIPITYKGVIKQYTRFIKEQWFYDNRNLWSFA